MYSLWCINTEFSVSTHEVNSFNGKKEVSLYKDFLVVDKVYKR
jgi:hypothetical protein